MIYFVCFEGACTRKLNVYEVRSRDVKSDGFSIPVVSFAFTFSDYFKSFLLENKVVFVIFAHFDSSREIAVCLGVNDVDS